MEIYIELVYLFHCFLLYVSLECMIVLLQVVPSRVQPMKLAFLLSFTIGSLYIDGLIIFSYIYWFLVFTCFFKKQVFLFFPTFLLVYFSISCFLVALDHHAYLFGVIVLFPIQQSFISLIGCAVLFSLLQVVYVVYVKKKIKKEEYQYDVKLQIEKEIIHCVGFLDTGNDAYYKGYPLLFIREGCLSSYKNIDEMIIPGVVDQSVSIIKIDKLWINHQEIEKVYGAVSTNLQYDCLLHGVLMGGII